MALFAVLGLAAAGCQKDSFVATQATVAEVTVNYSAGDQYGSVVLDDNTSWDLFLDRMLALAREGYEVTIFNNASPNSTGAKETVVFNTDNEDEAKQWAKEMTLQGYHVTIKFDDDTGIYTCTAIM